MVPFHHKIAQRFKAMHPMRHKILFLGASWMMVTLLAASFFLKPTSVVTYDIQHSIHAFSDEAMHLQLSQEKMMKLSQRFARVLHQTVKTYAKEHHVVIVKPSEVLAGAEDRTSDIEQAITLKMKEENSTHKNNEPFLNHPIQEK